MPSYQCIAISRSRALVISIAFIGLAFVSPTEIHAGPPPFCDIVCNLDKKCSVDGGEPQDRCDIASGDEVTYVYQVDAMGYTVRVFDDKLGVIGNTGDLLTKTTTLTETTTNEAWIVSEGECFCAFGNFWDSLTVFVHQETPTPTPSATPTSTPVPTPTPTLCVMTWPESQIITIAKGQSPTNNAKLVHTIRGHIIDPNSLGASAHRIEVCSGTEVSASVSDTSGSPINTASGSLQCTTDGCHGQVNVTEKYHSTSADGRDKDSITFIPK